MIKNYTLLIILLFIFSLKSIIAQNVEFNELSFPDKKKECRRAVGNINKADELLASGAGKYQLAIPYYLKANSFNPNNALLNYKLGVCYMNTYEKYKAVPYLEKAYQLNKAVKNDIAYQMGQAYHYNYEFDKAIAKYSEYLKSLSSFDKDANGPKTEKRIQECRNAKEIMRVPVNVRIKNVGSLVNTEYRDYSPIVNADQSIMFFTSRRPNTVGKRIATYDGIYYEDIYITYNKDTIWETPKHPRKPLNTKVHDAIVGVSKDGKTLLTYKVTPRDNGDIYISRLKEDKYTKPKRLNRNINTEYHETSASMSPDGTTLYFVSDRPGGYGGADLWYSVKDSKGDWGKPVNMGNTLNTSFREEGVFMQADGKTLYYSSEGHNSMGGLDIYVTTFENGKWTAPKNIGFPINTPEHDVFFSITEDGKHAYYSSAQKGGYGELDIYEILFLDSKINIIAFRGKVLDADTKKPLCSKITIRNSITGKVVDTLNSDCRSGDFYAKVTKGIPYTLNIESPEYYLYTENVPKDKDVNKVIYLKKLKPLQPKGYVFDKQTKEPVCADVTIKDKETNKTADSLRSDCKTGEYSSPLPIGKPYEIIVTHPEYIPYKENIKPDQDVNKIIYIEKRRPQETVGYVYDAVTKEPVCNADVIVANFQSKAKLESLKSDCQTGLYQSKEPKGKKYKLDVIHPEYIPHTENIEPSQDVNKIIYLYKPEAPKPELTKGTVYDDETKLPVCNADVNVKNMDAAASAPENLKSNCPDGKFQSKQPKGPKYELTVNHPDYLPYKEPLQPGQDPNKDVYLKKKPLPLIPGTVYDDETKLPVCNADVNVKNMDAATSAPENLKSNCPDGKFQSKQPKGPKYELTVIHPDYLSYKEPIPAGENPNKDVYLKKKPPLPVTEGVVYDADTKEPVCDANLDVKNATTKQSVDKLKSGCPDGKYQTKAPKGPKYELVVTHPDYIPLTEPVNPGQDPNKIIYIKKLPPPVLTFGNVYDVDTKEPVCSDVIVKNAQTKVVVDELKTDCPSGQFQSKAPKGKKYILYVNAPDYIPYEESINPGQDVNKVVYIKKISAAIAEGKLFDIKAAKSFVLPDILYDLDKFNIKPQYEDSLNSLINTMRAFPNIVVELGSHTDIRASDAYNEKLSFNRAKAVVDYLILKGLDPARLVAKGYGEKYPRVLDRDRYVMSCNKKFKFEKGTQMTEAYIMALPGGKCEMEAAHQLNRRTEFKVLREDYVPGQKQQTPVKIDVIKK
ncbi:MAG: PD40 domain-containing protein [Bacteroidales bacterium]|nr:PD40 domain-containing protein [Bacteroidales bacterium]